MGLSEEDRGRVFGKFFRAENPAVRKVAGAGLGLFISRHLIEAQGGRIWVKSVLGAGSTFGFALPQASEEARGLDAPFYRQVFSRE
jgi:signal transduction histidine kinase